MIVFWNYDLKKICKIVIRQKNNELASPLLFILIKYWLVNGKGDVPFPYGYIYCRRPHVAVAFNFAPRLHLQLPLSSMASGVTSIGIAPLFFQTFNSKCRRGRRTISARISDSASPTLTQKFPGFLSIWLSLAHPSFSWTIVVYLRSLFIC